MLPTFRLRRLIVRLTHQFPVLHQIELVSRVQLPGAHNARETLQVVNVVLGPSHNLRRRDPQVASSTLRAEPSAPTARHTYTSCIVTSVLLYVTPRCLSKASPDPRGGELIAAGPDKASEALGAEVALIGLQGCDTYLKKSSLQKSWPLRAKHLSVSWMRQSLH